MTDLQKTSLYQKHRDLKAKMVPFAGWDMPIQYSSVKEESLAVRKGVGIFDVSHMGEFIVKGKDASKFVNYLLTNEFESIEPGKAVYSPLCNDQGFIIDDLIAYKIEQDEVLICVNAANCEKDWQWIKSKHEGFDCIIENVSNDFSLIAVQGPETFETLKSLSFFSELKDIGYYEVQKFNDQLIVSRTGYTGEDGFEVFCSHKQALDIWQDLLQANATPCGLAARDVLRTEAAYPLYGNELSEELTPLDAGLRWTAKLTKSSFVGKQALADYEPKKRLIKLSLNKGIPRRGYQVKNQNGEVIGIVTSGTLSPSYGKGIAMALIEKANFPKDKKFQIEIRNKLYLANYHQSAFIKGSHK